MIKTHINNQHRELKNIDRTPEACQEEFEKVLEAWKEASAKSLPSHKPIPRSVFGFKTAPTEATSTTAAPSSSATTAPERAEKEKKKQAKERKRKEKEEKKKRKEERARSKEKKRGKEAQVNVSASLVSDTLKQR